MLFVEAGNQETVKEAARQAFQMARPVFSQAVEEITGRKVIAFMSQVHFEPDMAAEIFVLEPLHGENGNASGLSR